MLDKWQKKEKPVFTGITRGTGGFGFGSGGGGGGGAGGPGPLGASGGNIADGLKPGNGYVYHTFGTPGTFTVQNQNEIEILVVGGGGATGAFCTGGGGGGGVVHATSYVISAGDHTITVGDGGTATSPGPDDSGGQGGDSYFGASGPARLTGYGGGRAAKWPTSDFPYSDPDTTNANGRTGGSGSGGVRNGPWPGNSAPSTYYSGKAATQVNPLNQDAPGTVTNYGNPGGDGGGAAPRSLVGGGGGGAGASGGDYPSSAGGAGQPFPGFAYPDCFPSPYLPGFATPTNSITGVQASPTSDHYGGGGGGARHLAGQGSNDGGGTAGGLGGGGRGGNGQPIREVDGVDYLGGGGGDGGGYEPKGSDGGKGIVIIRYPTANE